MYKADIIDGYIVAVGTNIGGVEISEGEYNNIVSVLKARPTPQQGYGYRLKADTLEWELCELPQDEGENAEG